MSRLSQGKRFQVPFPPVPLPPAVAIGRCVSPAAASVRGDPVMNPRSAKPCPMLSLMPSACLASPPGLSSTRRTAVYGPVRTVVWEARGKGSRYLFPAPGTFSPAQVPFPPVGKRGVAWRYPSADGFLRRSSQIRAALRCFSSRTRNEKPHRNPSADGYLCATRSEGVKKSLGKR